MSCFGVAVIPTFGIVAFVLALYSIMMADTRTPEQRRRIMQAVGTKDTGPEWIVRRLLHKFGYRYRLHAKHLPGKPDIVLPGRKSVIFVHGCFWHAHDCDKGRAPKSKLDYWGPKLAANVERDAKRTRELEALGWNVMTVWQCETKDERSLLAALVGFVEGSDSSIDRAPRIV